MRGCVPPVGGAITFIVENLKVFTCGQIFTIVIDFICVDQPTPHHPFSLLHFDSLVFLFFQGRRFDWVITKLHPFQSFNSVLFDVNEVRINSIVEQIATIVTRKRDRETGNNYIRKKVFQRYKTRSISKTINFDRH